jgi:hypothetical protein
MGTPKPFVWVRHINTYLKPKQDEREVEERQSVKPHTEPRWSRVEAVKKRPRGQASRAD